MRSVFKKMICMVCAIFVASGAQAAEPLRIRTEKVLESSIPLKRLYGSPQSVLSKKLTVRVVNVATGVGVPGLAVEFRNIVRPEKALPLAFDSSFVTTDQNGIATTGAALGSKAGDYVVSARVEPQAMERAGAEPTSDDTVLFEITARERSWAVMLVMELLAGLALFMYGIGQLSIGMRATAGQRLRRAMELMTNNRFLAMLVGIFITVLFQSSCATTVMLVSFVQAGLLRSVQSLAIILGADIGTTMTVQLFAFKVTDYTLIAVSIGFFMQSVAKRASGVALGQTILGLGLLFFGMNMMQQATLPLRSYEPVVQLLTNMNSIAPAVLAGSIFTALIRSSAAFIGIVIVFASQGLVSLETGIALCLGANLGTCVTAVLASFKTSVEAKRVALAHALFKIFGITILIAWIPTFAHLVKGFSGEASTVERQIANAHTLFNVGIAFLFLPLLNPFNKLIHWILPTPVKKHIPKFVLEKNLLKTPALALSAAKHEILTMGRDAQRMVQQSLLSVFVGEPSVDRAALSETERSLDERYAAVREFLSVLMERRLPEREAQEVLLALRTIHDIEQIADIVEDRIIPRVEILRDNGIMLSEAGRVQLQEYHTKVLKQISRSLELFNTLDASKASRISERFERYAMMAYELKDEHFRRLQNHVVESEQTTNVHLNLVSALFDISNLATNIARHMKERTKACEAKPLNENTQVAPSSVPVSELS